MAFNPGGTDYAGFLRQRAQADEGVTRALDRKGRAEKAARIKKSGERSQLAKIGSAVARGAAAYYTGGMSEQMGGGEMIDEAMLGTDSEGRAVRNEYGGLVKAGSAIYQGSKAQKAGKLGEQDARFDKLLARRSKNVSDLYAAGDLAGGKEAQQRLEAMEATYNTNRRDAEGKGWGGSGLGMSDEDYQLQPEAMTQEQMDAKRKILDGGGGTTPTDTSPTEFTAQEESRFRPRSSLMPPPADAPTAPDASLPGQLGGRQSLQTPKSAAIQYETSGGGSPSIQAQQKQEKDDFVERIKSGYSQGRSGENRGTSLRDAYKQQAGGGEDFTNARLTPEEKRRMFLQGHYVN